MTKIVQLSGGTRETQDLYTGAARELTVDISNWALRLHDGVTPGGYTFLNRDQADDRYQAYSPELSGLIGFEPQNRGWVVRRGPADYRLRTILGTTGQITVSNGTGYAGNPAIGLADDITTDHTFSGTITFSLAIEAEGGINGDVVGNVTGNLTGDVTGDVTGDLTGNANGNHTGTFTGDVDTSAHTLILGDGQVNLDSLAPDTLAFIAGAGAPAGVIVAWYGDINDIPAGWFLCDGSNATPDLRDRFIFGAGGTKLPNQTGGSAQHQHELALENTGAHTHPVAVGDTVLTLNQIPEHKHGNAVAVDNNPALTRHPYGSLPSPGGADVQLANDTGNPQSYTSPVGGLAGVTQPHTHSGATSASGAHSHDGISDIIDHRPPYVALAYIMKGL